jgi:hypothetical protein
MFLVHAPKERHDAKKPMITVFGYQNIHEARVSGN